MADEPQHDVAAPSGPDDLGVNLRGKTTPPLRFSKTSRYVLLVAGGVVLAAAAYGLGTIFISHPAPAPIAIATSVPLQSSGTGVSSGQSDALDKVLGEGPKADASPGADGSAAQDRTLPPINGDGGTGTNATNGVKPAAGQDALSKALANASKPTGSDPLADATTGGAGNGAGVAGAGTKAGGGTDATDFSQYTTGPNVKPMDVGTAGGTVPNAGPDGAVQSATGGGGEGSGRAHATGTVTTLYVGSDNVGQGSQNQATSTPAPATNVAIHEAADQSPSSSTTTTSSGATAGANAAQAAAISFANGQGPRPLYSTSTRTDPIGKYELWATTIIPALLDSAINSDLPGTISAHVRENVYDSKTGQTLLIPKGSHLVGRYNTIVQAGLARVQVLWDRIIWPDGRFIALDAQAGTEPDGNVGLIADENDHIGRILTASVFTAVISGGAQVLANSGSSSGTTISVGQSEAQSVGGTLAQTGQTYINKQAAIPPEFTVPYGKPFNVTLDRTIILPEWRYK